MNKIFDYKKLLLNNCNSITISSNNKDLEKFELIYKNLYKEDVYYLDDDNVNDSGNLLEDFKNNINGKKFIIFKTKFDDLHFYKHLKNITLKYSNIIFICLIETEYHYIIQLTTLYISKNDLLNFYYIAKDKCSYMERKDIKVSEIDIIYRNLKIDILCQ